jgi:uncharacterized protein YdaU (DUF1376 family)
MPLFTDDWLSSLTIAGFTAEQEGAYVRLLLYEWKDPTCTLPFDEPTLANYSKLGSRWKKVGRPIIAACFIQREGRLVNLKLYEVWQRVQEKSAKAKAAAEGRWARERQGHLSEAG